MVYQEALSKTKSSLSSGDLHINPIIPQLFQLDQLFPPSPHFHRHVQPSQHFQEELQELQDPEAHGRCGNF